MKHSMFKPNVLFLSIFVVLVFCNGQKPLSAQQTKRSAVSGSSSEKRKSVSPTLAQLPDRLSIKLNYPAGNLFLYTFDDTTVVKRVYSDSSVLEYTRTTKYYISKRALKSPENGKVQVEVNVDSLEYSFSSGGSKIEYNKSKVGKMDLKFPDLIAAVVPENRTFIMEYSPYWEVVSTKGEHLEWLDDYIEKGWQGNIDTMEYWIWKNGIKKSTLSHFADIQKGAIPDSRVQKDSVWKKPFIFRVDGYDVRDNTAETRIIDYSNGLYTLETQIKTPTLLKQSVRMYPIKQLVDIISITGEGTNIIRLNKSGVIDNAKTDIITNATMKVNREVFTQNVHSIYSWKLRGQYQY